MLCYKSPNYFLVKILCYNILFERYFCKSDRVISFKAAVHLLFQDKKKNFLVSSDNTKLRDNLCQNLCFKKFFKS